MPTSTLTLVNSFVESLAEKKHDLGSDTFKIALTNSAPATSNTVLADITEISYTNCSSRTLTISSSSQTSGSYKQIINDLVLTASGGDVGPFRYVVMYNDTTASDELIGWWDYNDSITLHDAETLTLDLSAVNGAVQLNKV